MGAILLAPQGTTQISEGKYDWGSNLDEIEENILDAINKVMDEHKVDQSRVVLAGFSQGGWIAWSLGARNPDAFRGLIPVCGRFEAPSETEIDEEALAKLRIYAMVGADDDEAILKSNRDAEKRYKKLGAKVKLRVYDDVGHAYPDDAEEEELQALEFVLGN
jgi:predicted esterase